MNCLSVFQVSGEKVSKISLVDLAGSERQAKTGEAFIQSVNPSVT